MYELTLGGPRYAWLDGRMRPSLRETLGLRNTLGFDYFSTAQAGRADADVLGRGSHFGVHRAQVDVPAPLGHVVGVADVISELRPLAADITNSCHKL